MRLDGTERRYRYSSVILLYPRETLFTKCFLLTNSTKYVKKALAKSTTLSSRGMQVVWRDWCVLRHFSATDVRIERSKRRSTNGHDYAEGHNRYSGTPGELRLGDGGNGGHDPATAGKLAAPCGPQARAQRGPGPPLLPGKVRSHGSDRWDIFHFFKYPIVFSIGKHWRCYICFHNILIVRVILLGHLYMRNNCSILFPW